MLGPNQKKWLEALRSGEFHQGRKELETEDGKYCCLGVGAVIFGCVRTESRLYDGCQCSAPLKVKEALALYDYCGSMRHSIHCLMALNDDGKSFNEIADMIEANPRDFFLEAR